MIEGRWCSLITFMKIFLAVSPINGRTTVVAYTVYVARPIIVQYRIGFLVQKCDG